MADVQGGTTAEGIHLGVMAGTVDLVQPALTGMRARGRVLRFDPASHTPVEQLRSNVHHRGHRLELAFSGDRVKAARVPARRRRSRGAVERFLRRLDDEPAADLTPATGPVPRSRPIPAPP